MPTCRGSRHSGSTNLPGRRPASPQHPQASSGDRLTRSWCPVHNRWSRPGHVRRLRSAERCRPDVGISRLACLTIWGDRPRRTEEGGISRDGLDSSRWGERPPERGPATRAPGRCRGGRADAGRGRTCAASGRSGRRRDGAGTVPDSIPVFVGVLVTDETLCTVTLVRPWMAITPKHCGTSNPVLKVGVTSRNEGSPDKKYGVRKIVQHSSLDVQMLYLYRTAPWNTLVSWGKGSEYDPGSGEPLRAWGFGLDRHNAATDGLRMAAFPGTAPCPSGRTGHLPTEDRGMATRPRLRGGAPRSSALCLTSCE